MLQEETGQGDARLDSSESLSRGPGPTRHALSPFPQRSPLARCPKDSPVWEGPAGLWQQEGALLFGLPAGSTSLLTPSASPQAH